MTNEGLAARIERFNEDNDEFTIGMNFLVAGISRIQDFIQDVQAGATDLAAHRAPLDEAQQMLAFAADKVGDGSVGAFVVRYRAFAQELREHV